MRDAIRRVTDALRLTVATAFVVLIAAVVLSVIAGVARGQDAQTCAPYERVADYLRGQWGEQELAFFLSGDMLSAFAVWGAADQSTWSIVVVDLQRDCATIVGDGMVWAPGPGVTITLPPLGDPA